MKELTQTDGIYEGHGFTMAREEGKTPNGNEMNGKWVLRDSTGEMIDFDQYRSDLAERNDIQLESNINITQS